MNEKSEELVTSFYAKRDESVEINPEMDPVELQALDRELRIIDQFEVPQPREGFESRIWGALKGQVVDDRAADEAGAESIIPLKGWWLRLAAVFLVFLFGWLLGTTGRSWRSQDPSEIEIASLKNEMQRLQQQMTILMLQQPDAIDRLTGVELSIPLAGASTGIAHRLMNLATSDPSVNVRLAALEVLAQSVRRDSVFNELTNALVRDTSPLVQAQLIELLSRGDSVDTTRILETIQSDPQRHPAVRRRAEKVLERML